MMWPRNCGPASFHWPRAPSARSPNRPLRVPIHNVSAMMKRIRARARHCQRQACSGGTGLTDEQMRRQHVERLEPAADVAEDALQVLQHARGELVDEKCPAGFEHIAGLAQYAFAQRCRNGAERNN